MKKSVWALAVTLVVVMSLGAAAATLIVPFYNDSGNWASQSGVVTFCTLSNTGATETITLQYLDLNGSDVTPTGDTASLLPGLTAWRPYYDAPDEPTGATQGESLNGWSVPDAAPGAPDVSMYGTVVITCSANVEGAYRLVDFSLSGASGGGVANMVAP